MLKKRLLSKSRFKLGCECPTKLFYTGKPTLYADKKIEDPFLKALADGGFQVGELAKHYFPGGVEIGRGDYQTTAEQTRKLIESGDAIIYEAAFLADGFFIYSDVIVCKGNTIELYEVKAKSYKPGDEFVGKRGSLSAEWQPYLLDVAFQKMVIQKAFPGYEVKAHLTLADKSSLCPTDGLSQKFRIKRIGDKMEVITGELNDEDLSQKVLINVPVDDVCEKIYSSEAYKPPAPNVSFEDLMIRLAEIYATDERVQGQISKDCKGCEFKATPIELANGLRDGFKECWSREFNWTESDFSTPTILDIWDFRGKDKLIAENRIKMAAVTEGDLKVGEDGKPGISRTMRQWYQVSKARDSDNTYVIEKDLLAGEIAKWSFPLHFIDFETSMPAIPFKKGRRPYEAIAFQFSHHLVHSDGTIEHKNEYLNAKPGSFPNYDFLRALKDSLSSDNGTIFRFSHHENSYLNFIYTQIIDSNEKFNDRDELLSFIKTITRSPGKAKEPWEGDRCMVDMCELVKRYYYDPLTNGSNSIKQVLPAILQRSEMLQEKYSQPIYGAQNGIKSLNFQDQVWIKLVDGKVADPYTLLPKMFADVSAEDFDVLMSDHDELKDGGAALTAYAKLQFQEMTDYERTEIETALLKYCELDTFAMVLIYEGWKDLLR